ncbi:MAG: hypothetical protein ACP5VP_11165 [Candidatus Limnocylindrales bacterium]
MTPRLPAGALRRAWVWTPLALATGSRVFSAALVLVANTLSHPHRRDPFVAWNGSWYLQIAKSGYHAAPVTLSATNAHDDFAFFPLWPIGLRLSTLGVLPAALTAVVLANLLFILAAVLLWRLLAERFAAALATGAVRCSPSRRPRTCARWPTRSRSCWSSREATS